MRDSIPWGLVLIVVAFCVLGGIYSVIVPLFEAPDEIWHFSFIQVLATRRALPVQPTEGKDMWLREAGQPPLYHLVSALLVAPLDTSDFPGFVRFNLAHPAVNATSQSEAPNVFIHTPHEAYPYRGAVLAVHLVRLFGVLWGAGTIVGVYLVAREVVPTRPRLALVAAAVTAFNPHFIFISSVVNNDAAAACLCTLVLWLSIRIGQAAKETRFPLRNLVSTFALGVLLGLALLSKVSALALLPLVALALGLAWWRDRDVRALLARGASVFGPAVLVASWWYVRNWVLYGDPLGWGIWLVDIGVQRITLAELVRQFGHVATSFWSPYDGLLPEPVFWVLGLFLAAAAAGWVRMIARRDVRTGAGTNGLLLTGVWFILLFASLVRYMTTTPSNEGRLLFPGIAACSLLLVLGWSAIVPRRWQGAAMSVVGAGLLVLSTATPFFAIAPRYALPLVTSTKELSGMVPFDDVALGNVRVLGARVEPDEFQAGDEVDVTLYWEARGTPPTDLRAVVRLWTMGGRLVGQRDQLPAGEAYPPDMWQEGDVIRDVYRVEVQVTGPARCRVWVSVLNGDELLGEIWSPAASKLAAPVHTEEIMHPLAYDLDRKVALIGYRVPDDPPSSGGVLTVTLYWRALNQVDVEYQVFVHLLDAQGNTLGQGDGPPLGGDYPTNSWVPGEEMADTHLVPLGADLPADAYLMVGLYRLTDGVRLPVYDSTGERVLHDAVRLDLVDLPAAPAEH